MNYLITGGSGFIGTHLVEALLRAPNTCRIHILDLHRPRIEDPRITFWECDIRRPIRADIADCCDVCFHLAALCKEPGYEWDEYFRTNYEGTRNIIKFVSHLAIPNLIYTSTMMVFRAGDHRRSETSPVCPDTAYGMSKLLGELALEVWHEQAQGRCLKIVRPAVVFGKWECGNYTRLYYALKRRCFFFVGRRTTVKSSVYVKDLVRCLLFLINDKRRYVTYNVAMPEETSIATVCAQICAVHGFRRRPLVVPYTLALWLARFCEVLNAVGLKNPIHHRRIQKLYHSTNIAPDGIQAAGFRFDYNLEASLQDWRRDCMPNDLF